MSNYHDLQPVYSTNSEANAISGPVNHLMKVLKDQNSGGIWEHNKLSANSAETLPFPLSMIAFDMFCATYIIF